MLNQLCIILLTVYIVIGEEIVFTSNPTEYFENWLINNNAQFSTLDLRKDGREHGVFAKEEIKVKLYLSKYLRNRLVQ